MERDDGTRPFVLDAWNSNSDHSADLVVRRALTPRWIVTAWRQNWETNMLGVLGRSSSALGRDIEDRLQSLERSIERFGRARGVVSGAGALDRMSDTLVSALSGMANRIRSGSHTFGDDAAAIGEQVGKFGSTALRRATTEAKDRPLVTMAVAIGVGVLIGMIAARR
jgi:ElaB/YqjD/DUF883 family membrane-anchored ribosome-binding protein